SYIIRRQRSFTRINIMSSSTKLKSKNKKSVQKESQNLDPRNKCSTKGFCESVLSLCTSWPKKGITVVQMFDLKTMEEGSYYLAWKEDNRLFGKWKAFNYCPA